MTLDMRVADRVLGSTDVDVWMDGWRVGGWRGGRWADERYVARQCGSLGACSRVLSMTMCVYVHVCLRSMWASEHGTE